MNDTKSLVLDANGNTLPNSEPQREEFNFERQSVSKEEILETLEASRKQKEADAIKASENTITVKLPSNGLINPNITEVTLKRMTTKQSKALFTSSDPNYLTTLLLSCIVEPVNIKATDLHSNDVVYLLFILRYISSPKSLIQKVICQRGSCQHEYEQEVKVNEMPVTYATPDKYVLNCKLPDKGDTIVFKILSEGELINCENIANRKIKQENIPVAEEEWTRMLGKIAYMIQTVNDKEFATFNEKLAYIEELSYYDFEYFNKVYNDIITSFGVERKVVSTCPKCGNTNEVYAYISPEFFRLI